MTGTVTITHTMLDGTLIDGLTRDDTRRGNPIRAILDQQAWRWMPSIAQWGQRSSRGQLPRRHRIDATARGLRDLGLDVEVTIDATPADQATMEDNRGERLDARADRLEARADRNITEGNARADRAQQFFHDLNGQPLLPGHYSYKSDLNRRNKHAANWDKGLSMITSGELDQKRADTARDHMDHRHSPQQVRNRITRLETELRDAERDLAGRKQWVTEPDGRQVYRAYHPTGTLLERYTERRDHLVAQLDYWRTLHHEHIATGKFTVWTSRDLRPGDLVSDRARVGAARYEVVRVNRVTVTVKTGFGFDLKMRLDQIQQAWRDGKPHTPGATPEPPDAA